MKQFQKCPVCDGAGLVSQPRGIVDNTTRAEVMQNWSVWCTAPCECWTCGGKGVIETPDMG